MSDLSFYPAYDGSQLYWANAPVAGGYGVGMVYLGPYQGGGVRLAGSWGQTMASVMYVFIGNVPAQDGMASLASDLAGYLRSNPAVRLLWLTDASLGAWAGAAVSLQMSPSVGTVLSGTMLPMGNYAAVLGTSVTVRLNATFDGLVIAEGPTGAAGLDRTDPASHLTLSWPLNLDASVTNLPLTGDFAGSLLMNVPLSGVATNSGPVDWFKQLDVGLRYGVPDSEKGEGSIRSLAYPLFATPTPVAAQMSCRLNPAMPLDAARTCLYYTNAVAQPSCFLSPAGMSSALTPVTDGDAPAGFVLQRRPSSAGDNALYFAPAGQFLLSRGAQTAAEDPLLLAAGLSGTEFFATDAAEGIAVTFVPSQPALVTAEGFSDVATAPRVILSGPAGREVLYQSQPAGQTMFQADPDAQGEDALFLRPMPVPGVAVNAGGSAYPMVPYGGVPAGSSEAYRVVEQRALAPARQAALAPAQEAAEQRLQRAQRSVHTVNLIAPPAMPRTGVTPQGLIGTFTPDYSVWTQLSMVRAEAAQTVPSLALNNLRGDLRAAMTNSQLFLVAADAGLFMSQCDLNYRITTDVLLELAALPESERPPAADLLALQHVAPSTVYQGLSAFNAYLNAQHLTASNAQKAVIAKYAAYFEVGAAGWTFRVAPTLWGLDAARPTVMIMKFSRGTLRSLVKTPSAWSWRDVGATQGSTTTTSTRLTTIIDQATTEVNAARQTSTPSPLEFFVQTVCDDPAWTGVIFLDAQLPLATMPKDLQGLAFGVDRTQLRAHHVGISVSPVVNGGSEPALGATSVFGLIDYSSPEDIPYTAGDFELKVLRLQTLIRNSAATSFTCRAEIFINKLFGDGVTLTNSTHGNNLLLTGNSQRQGGAGQYTFSVAVRNRYASESAVVESIEFNGASFTTESVLTATSAAVRSKLKLKGKLRFRTQRAFDVFSYGPATDAEGNLLSDGYLRFNGLAVDIVTTPQSSPMCTYALNASEMSFDVSASAARPLSLAARFPVTPTAMLYGEPGRSPRDLGYQAVKTPLYQPALSGGWYGLVFTLDMGNLGTLAAGAGLSVRLLAAWGPGSGQAAVNVGLQLPGAQAMKSLPAIEGILGLGFDTLAFDANGSMNVPPDPAYVMRLERFYLSLLGWKLPPGQADMYLFGDPTTGSQRSSALGWYAAWSKES